MSLEISDNLVWVKMLAQGCPLWNALPECPLTELRELSALECLATIDRMPEQELAAIIRYHKMCLASRENETAE